MKTFLKSAVIALTLAGTAFGVSIGSANTAKADNVGFYVGPGGVHIGYQQGYYYDRHHRRQNYRYPTDYRRYHHDREWYRHHQSWHDQRHNDWYRR